MTIYGPYGGYSPDGNPCLLEFRRTDGGQYRSFVKYSEAAKMRSLRHASQEPQLHYAYDFQNQQAFCFILVNGELYRAPLTKTPLGPRATALFSPSAINHSDWNLVNGKLARNYGVNPDDYLQEERIEAVTNQFPSVASPAQNESDVLHNAVNEQLSEISEAVNEWNRYNLRVFFTMTPQGKVLIPFPNKRQQKLNVMTLKAAWLEVEELSVDEKKVLLQAVTQAKSVTHICPTVSAEIKQVINEFRQSLFPEVIATLYDNERYYSSNDEGPQTMVGAIQAFYLGLVNILAANKGVYENSAGSSFAHRVTCNQFNRIHETNRRANRFVQSSRPDRLLYRVLSDESQKQYSELFSFLIKYSMQCSPANFSVEEIYQFREALRKLYDDLVLERQAHSLVQKHQQLFPSYQRDHSAQIAASDLINECKMWDLQLETILVFYIINLNQANMIPLLLETVSSSETLRMVVATGYSSHRDSLKLYLESGPYDGFICNGESLCSMIYVLRRLYAGNEVRSLIMKIGAERLRQLINRSSVLNDVCHYLSKIEERRLLIDMLGVEHIQSLIIDFDSLDSVLNASRNLAIEDLSPLSLLYGFGEELARQWLSSARKIRMFSGYMNENHKPEFFSLLGGEHLAACCTDAAAYVHLYYSVHQLIDVSQYFVDCLPVSVLTEIFQDEEIASNCMEIFIEDEFAFWKFIELHGDSIPGYEDKSLTVTLLDQVSDADLREDMFDQVELLTARIRGLSQNVKHYIFTRIGLYHLGVFLEDKQSWEELYRSFFGKEASKDIPFSESNFILNKFVMMLYFSLSQCGSGNGPTDPGKIRRIITSYDELIMFFRHLGYAIESYHSSGIDAYSGLMIIGYNIIKNLCLNSLLEGNEDAFITLIQQCSSKPYTLATVDQILLTMYQQDLKTFINSDTVLIKVVSAVYDLASDESASERLCDLMDNMLSTGYMKSLANSPENFSAVRSQLSELSLPENVIDHFSESVNSQIKKRKREDEDCNENSTHITQIGFMSCSNSTESDSSENQQIQRTPEKK